MAANFNLEDIFIQSFIIQSQGLGNGGITVPEVTNNPIVCPPPGGGQPTTTCQEVGGGNWWADNPDPVNAGTLPASDCYGNQKSIRMLGAGGVGNPLSCIPSAAIVDCIVGCSADLFDCIILSNMQTTPQSCTCIDSGPTMCPGCPTIYNTNCMDCPTNQIKCTSLMSWPPDCHTQIYLAGQCED
jgi:hypothetical protein